MITNWNAKLYNLRSAINKHDVNSTKGKLYSPNITKISSLNSYQIHNSPLVWEISGIFL